MQLSQLSTSWTCRLYHAPANISLLYIVKEQCITSVMEKVILTKITL